MRLVFQAQRNLQEHFQNNIIVSLQSFHPSIKCNKRTCFHNFLRFVTKQQNVATNQIATFLSIIYLCFRKNSLEKILIYLVEKENQSGK